MARQPALTLTGIIVGEQMGSARVPSSPKSLAQFKSYTRIMLNVADVSRLHAMLCHYPELVSDAPISDWRASWLTRPPPGGFQQRIPRQRQTHRKGELDRRVQQVFLKRVNDLMFHFVVSVPAQAFSLRVAIVLFVILIIFLAISFVFLFVFFLGWLLSKEDIGCVGEF